MDQVATSGEILHDSSRSNEILTLLRSFINQSSNDFRTTAATQADLSSPATVSGAAANVVVAATAGISDPQRRQQQEEPLLATFHRQQASSSSDATLDGDCSCSGVEECLDPNDEVTEEEIAQLGDIGPEIIESVTAASSHGFVNGEELIRPNNICKTINEIASSQHIPTEIGNMPQNNSLLEAALISNITSAAAAASQSGGNDFLVQAALGMDQTQGGFHVQNWNVDAMNAANVPCDSSAYVNRQTFPVPGVNQPGLPATFTNPALEGGGYLQYASQPQFGMARHDQPLIGNQLHGVPFGISDYQGNVLRADAINATAARSQDMTQAVHSKINNAYQGMNFNPTSVAMSPNTDLSTIPYSGAYSSNVGKGMGSHRHGQQPTENRLDSGSEECASEDRTGEKKLTTTPIPSDAEKMSSSNSVSSGSHDESPSSPGEPDVHSGNPALSQAAATGTSDYHLNASGDFGQMVGAGTEQSFANNDMLLNEESMMNSIPVADSVVELSSLIDIGEVGSKLATKKHLEEMNAADTWSVRKEKRKRRLHKKHKKSKHQEEGIGSGSLADAPTSGREQNADYRQQHQSKHRISASDAQHLSPSSSLSSSSKSPMSESKLGVSYSAIIPKTTADPISIANAASSGNMKSGKSAESKSKNWDGAKHKDKSGDKKHRKRQNNTGANYHDHKIIAPASLHMPLNSGSSGGNYTNNPNLAVKPSPEGENSACSSSQNAVVRRWQTVTAIQGPKLPPMLSESDRIPKRGRPSKKMKELNLKFKSNEPAADPVLQTKVKPSESASKMVSMYTINDKGFIEVLNQKPKENRRSKERAEAFRNHLAEISKRSSIQKKTAGAKDVVGAFKQIGVRTRNRASTTPGSSTGDDKKRPKSKGKVFGGDAANATSSAIPETSTTEDGMYTFSELANKYKISDSIVYRAMEQSQRNVLARGKSTKIVQKAKPTVESAPKLEFQREKDKAYRPNDQKHDKKKSSVLSVGPIAKEQYNSQQGEKLVISETKAEKVTEIRTKPQDVNEILSSDPISHDKVKRKKKKKKHKKEKHEDGKRKKNRDKKKKKKKERRSSDGDHEQEAKIRFQQQQKSDVNNNQTTNLPFATAERTVKKKKPKMSGSSSSSLGSSAISTRPESTTSLSDGEDNAYDGGDSSSEVETIISSETIPPTTSVNASSQPTTPLSITQSVFGSGIASSQMPSFQGIKEHGGLVQFSEHTRKIEEMHDARVKKHKKKKKLVRRSKNVADPAFLYNMEELSQQLARTKLSTTLSFLSGSPKQENVFARDFRPKSKVSGIGGKCVDDPLSYRDPSKNRFKSKRQPVAVPGFGVFSGKADGRKLFNPEQFQHVSTFCRLGFFAEHGLVKPYSGGSPIAFLKSISAQAPKKTSVPSETSRQEVKQVLGAKKTPNTQPGRRTERVESKTQHDSMPQSESESESAGSGPKRARRKRGWPLGKPRGPRSKKPSCDEDASTDAELADKHKRSADLDPTSSSNTQGEQIQDDVGKRNAGKGKPNDSGRSEPGKETGQISHDLVNHIKAAIAASLTSSVPPDLVTKTVDSAVADYLSRVSDDTAKPEHRKRATQAASSSTNTHKQERKPRGRPPKHPKTLTDTGAKIDGDKTSEKPKKLWASKHQVAPPGRDLAERGVPGRPKKRGPGRPRKFPVVASLKQKPAVVRPSVKKMEGAFPPQGARRANASFAPSARPAVIDMQRKKAGKTKRPPIVIQKRPAKVKIPTDTVISSHHARLALGSLLSGKALREQSSSPAWLSSVNSPSPGLYHGQAAEGHMDDAINAAVRNAGGQGSDAGPSITCGQKVGPKKSLESVVARLKSRQSSTGEEMDLQDENCNTNNNNYRAAEKRTHSISGLQVDEDDAVHRKKLKTLHDPCAKSSDWSSSAFREASQTPEERKVFQTVGLFSAAFKMGSEDDLTAEEHEVESSPLMPPPLHAGKFLRKARKDFQLSYSVWWMYNRKLIRARQDPATQFVKIDSNVYVDTQPVAEQEEHICVCKTLSAIRSERSSEPSQEDELGGCGKECLNRLMYIECSPETCPCGEKCGNRAIQNKQWCSELERFRTEDRGWGVKTNSAIPEGQFILEYVGEVVSDREFRRRTIENYNAHSDHYCIQLEAGKVIDGYRMANEGRFVNHSCQPNCEMQKWVVDGEYRIGLFAKRKIECSEELTYDYNFHAYNLDRQQVCRCGTKECRGVIGGKTQRVYPESILNRMDKMVNKVHESETKVEKKHKTHIPPEQHYTTIVVNNVQLGIREIDSQQTAMLTKQERVFVHSRCLFLLRNLHQNKQQKQRIRQYRQKEQYCSKNGTALHEQNEPQDNETLLDTAISDVYTAVMTCKDENGISVAIPFINLPSRQQNPDYYQHVSDPLDLTCVEQRLLTKQYDTFDAFCSDMLRVFRNAEKYHGRKSTLGRDVARLRKAFNSARNAAAIVLGQCRDKTKKKDQEAERAELVERRKNSDFIRCICGIYKDEGVMIQCEKCYVWQHCDCMGVLPDDYNDERAYLCEECDERDVPDEIEVVPQPPNAPPGHTYYLTLRKDNMVIKQGDCVRIIHDHCLRQRSSNNPPVRTSYRLQSHSTPDRMDYLRIKKLWTDDNGDKFAYGHHFVRPHDIKHGEARRFYSNELIGSPFHEIVPLEAVVSVCCVMDVETYCLGKPKGVKEADIYISEHRCNASLRVIDKVVKAMYPVYTKPHVFETYEKKLTPVRDYQVSEQDRKTQTRRTQWLKATENGTKSDSESSGTEDCSAHVSSDDEEHSDETVDSSQHVSMETGGDEGESDSGNDRDEKKKRLNGILSKLMKDASSRAPSTSQSPSPGSE